MDQIRKRENCVKAFSAFERNIQFYNDITQQQDVKMLEIATASLIKHFELSYETLWKFLKFYLIQNFQLDISGSKNIIRSCYENNIINEPHLITLLDMVEVRNMTTHIYDSKESHQLCQTIIKFYPALKEIIEKLT